MRSAARSAARSAVRSVARLVEKKGSEKKNPESQQYFRVDQTGVRSSSRSLSEKDNWSLLKEKCPNYVPRGRLE